MPGDSPAPRQTYSPCPLLHNVMHILAANGRRPRPCHDEAAAVSAARGMLTALGIESDVEAL